MRTHGRKYHQKWATKSDQAIKSENISEQFNWRQFYRGDKENTT